MLFRRGINMRFFKIIGIVLILSVSMTGCSSAGNGILSESIPVGTADAYRSI